MFSKFGKDALTLKASLIALLAFALIGLMGMLPGSATAQIWGNPGSQTGSFGQADIPASQGRASLNVLTGKVVDIQATAIEVPASNEARNLGALLGGLVGAAAGRDRGWEVQGSLGTIGAAVGAKVAGNSSREFRQATQIIVRLDSGQVIAVVQEMNGIPVGLGDAVYVVGSYPAVRVVRAAWQSAQSAVPGPQPF